MAHQPNPRPQATDAGETDQRYDPALDEPLANADDPGGAHRKGYSAEPGPAPAAPDRDPIPLADDAAVHGHARRPDEDAVVPPTGRDEPKSIPRTTG